MARGRMISRSLSTSRKYAELAHEGGKLGEFAQALFPLLIVHADDYGLLEGDAWTVKHVVLPTSPRRVKDFELVLDLLHRVGLITLYEVENQKFVAIKQFDAHQQGLHKKHKPRLPEPPGNSGGFPEIPPEEKGTRTRTELEREGKRSPRASATAPSPDALIALWNDETRSPLPRCTPTSERQRQARTRLRSRPLEGASGWRAVFARCQASAFLRGENDRGWVVSLDWLLRNDTNAAKVLEGRYDPPNGGLEGAGPTPEPEPLVDVPEAVQALAVDVHQKWATRGWSVPRETLVAALESRCTTAGVVVDAAVLRSALRLAQAGLPEPPEAQEAKG